MAKISPGGKVGVQVLRKEPERSGTIGEQAGVYRTGLLSRGTTVTQQVGAAPIMQRQVSLAPTQEQIQKTEEQLKQEVIQKEVSKVDLKISQEQAKINAARAEIAKLQERGARSEAIEYQNQRIFEIKAKIRSLEAGKQDVEQGFTAESVIRRAAAVETQVERQAKATGISQTQIQAKRLGIKFKEGKISQKEYEEQYQKVTGRLPMIISSKEIIPKTIQEIRSQKQYEDYEKLFGSPLKGTELGKELEEARKREYEESLKLKVEPAISTKGQYLKSIGFRRGQYDPAKGEYSWYFDYSTFKPVGGTLSFLGAKGESFGWGFGLGKQETISIGAESYKIHKNVYQPEAFAKAGRLTGEVGPYFIPYAGQFILGARATEHFILPSGQEEIVSIGKEWEKEYGIPKETAWAIPIAELGLATAPLWYPKVKGEIRTWGRKEIKFDSPEYRAVVEGKATFPEAGKGLSWEQRAKLHYEKFMKPGELQIKYGHKAGGIHMYPETPSFYSTGGLTRPLHIAPQTGPSIYFGRTGATSAKEQVLKGTFFDKLIERGFGDILQPQLGAEPGGAFIEPTEFVIKKGVEVQRGVYKWYGGPPKPGQAAIVATKPELQAVFESTTKVIPTGGKFYFKYKGVKYPVDTFEALGKGSSITGAVIKDSKLLTDVTSSYVSPKYYKYKYIKSPTISIPSYDISYKKSSYKFPIYPTPSYKLPPSKSVSYKSPSYKVSYKTPSYSLKYKTPYYPKGMGETYYSPYAPSQKQPYKSSYYTPMKPSYKLPRGTPWRLPQLKAPRRIQKPKRYRVKPTIPRKPSLAALGLGIYAKTPSFGEETGIVLRPIIKSKKKKRGEGLAFLGDLQSKMKKSLKEGKKK